MYPRQQSINKKQMMFAISVSLAAYAFAISGCGSKNSPDDAAKGAALASIASLQGNWVAYPVDVKVSQKNLHMLTISKSNLKLRTVCLIAGDDKNPAVNAIAEGENTFTLEDKNIKFEKGTGGKSGEAPNDCAVNLAIGSIPYSIDGDKLTLGLNPDGSAAVPADSKSADPKTADPKAVSDKKIKGIVFTKSTAEKLPVVEKDFIAKSPAALAGSSKSDAALTGTSTGTSSGAGSSDMKLAVAGPAVGALAGAWIFQADDQQINDNIKKVLKKTNFDYINFNDKKSSFIERYACRIEQNNPADPLNKILETGFKIDLLNLNASDKTADIEQPGDWEKNAIIFEASATENSFVIKQKNAGPRLRQLLAPGSVSLSASDLTLTNCELGYAYNEKFNYSFSIDGKTLILTSELKGPASKREFHKYDATNPQDVATKSVIKKNTKDSSKSISKTTASAEVTTPAAVVAPTASADAPADAPAAAADATATTAGSSGAAVPAVTAKATSTVPAHADANSASSSGASAAASGLIDAQ